LKLQYDETLSTVAFNFNLCRYMLGAAPALRVLLLHHGDCAQHVSFKVGLCMVTLSNLR
jgi:hypothetical protein